MNACARSLSAIAVSLLVAACGGSGHDTSPVAPSDVTTVSDYSYGTLPTASSVITGTVSALAGSCPAVSFTLEGKKIVASTATKYSGGTCADVKNGARLTIGGTAQTGGTVLATGVMFAPPPLPPTVLVTGTVSAVAGTCPAITFTVETKKIAADAATKFSGGACGDVKNGVRVSAGGTVQTDGSVLAAGVVILPAPAPTPVLLIGTVGALSGTCPTLKFTAESKTIVTDAATRFAAGACGDVKVGGRVAVTATLKTDGTLLAVVLMIIPPPPPAPVVVTGLVNALSGACPAVKLTVEQHVFAANAATVYTGGTCADLKNGVKVTVGGGVQADGTLLAAGIAFVK